jgi:threonine dehydratase
MEIPDFDDVSAAQARIEPYVHRTPLLTSSYLDQLCGAELFFKCENLQKVGAFKARGAVNAVFGHSSGNHAGALSYAAMRRGIEATVVMPHNAPAAKKAAVRSYGGRIIECEPTQAAREAALAQVVADSGADAVHPYDDARVIAGQATCALEMHEDAGKLDGVVAPIGGGGLISGTCLSLSQVAPETRIYAAEPANADDAYQSFNKGEIVEKDAQQSVADGLKTNLKPRTWHFVSNYVTDILPRQRKRNTGRDVPDLGAYENYHRAVFGGAAGGHPEKQGVVPGAAHRRDYYRRQRGSQKLSRVQILKARFAHNDARPL